MTEEERRALGMKRRLAFQNIANGLPVEQIMEALKLSELEVEQARRFVAKKITQHLVQRRQAPIECYDVKTIRWNRKLLLGVLARIGNLDLSTELILKIDVQDIDHPEMVEGAKHKMKEAYE